MVVRFEELVAADVVRVDWLFDTNDEEGWFADELLINITGWEGVVLALPFLFWVA